jgi:hypothetical protein
VEEFKTGREAGQTSAKRFDLLGFVVVNGLGIPATFALYEVRLNGSTYSFEHQAGAIGEVRRLSVFFRVLSTKGSLLHRISSFSHSMTLAPFLCYLFYHINQLNEFVFQTESLKHLQRLVVNLTGPGVSTSTFGLPSRVAHYQLPNG